MQMAKLTSGDALEVPGIHDASLNDDEKWAAVLARDQSRDGSFVFAVRSTRIYCRPSCPAKHPNRIQVAFYSGARQAEDAGFRACLRCRPREATFSPASELVRRTCRYIEASLDKTLTLTNISAEIGVSPFHLQRTFKRLLGMSPRQYVEARRLERMKRSLRNGNTVTTALYQAGFSSRSRIYEKTPKPLGVDPGSFRRGGQGLSINYTTMDSPLGRLLLASTKDGLCAVCMGNSDNEIEASLREDYPEAQVSRNDAGLTSWVNALTDYFKGQPLQSNLPLDVRATAFQRRVWRQIQSIPYGSTATYSGIATALGEPKAARAVAKACATNPVSILIPCHRVVGKDGRLHGYRWGEKRKDALLKLEQTGPTGKKENMRQ